MTDGGTVLVMMETVMTEVSHACQYDGQTWEIMG
jgi:hypothetical protein